MKSFKEDGWIIDVDVKIDDQLVFGKNTPSGFDDVIECKTKFMFYPPSPKHHSRTLTIE